MIQHLWSILCRRCIIDSRTQNVSLIDVVEGIEAKGPEPAGGKETLVQVGSDFVTLWRRETIDRPVSGVGRVRFLRPDGSQAGETVEYTIDLTTRQRFRITTVVPILPVRSPGHWFVIELQNGENWVEVGRVPIEVAFQANPATNAV